MGITQSDRAIAYQLLSDILAKELTKDGLLRLASLGNAGDPAGLPEFDPLLERAAQLAAAPEPAARDLAGAFAFLFLGVGGKNGAPPYESVYVDERGRTGRAPTVAMERELSALDMHVLKSFPEPADHVAIELAVAARLAETDASNERQVTFLKERLAGWLPDFAAACARGDRTGFYASAASAAADFVSTDLDRLEAGRIPAFEEDDDA